MLELPKISITERRHFFCIDNFYSVNNKRIKLTLEKLLISALFCLKYWA
jgi:hypothetical protein